MSNTALATTAIFQSSGGRIKGKFSVHMGTVELTPRSFVFYAKPFWTMLFGLLGALLFSRIKGKPTEIDLRTVTSFGRDSFGLNKRVLDLTTTDGTNHRFIVDKFDEFLPRLQSAITQLGARLEPRGEEKWEVRAG